MSDAAVTEFNERMAADDTFRTKVMALTNMKERMQLINSEGFDCTAEEIAAASTELTEEDLALVAGGVIPGILDINLTFN